MSQLSANTLMPLFSALPEQEQHVFAEMVDKMLKKKAAPASKQPRQKTAIERVADQLGEEWLPENHEMLVSKFWNEY